MDQTADLDEIEVLLYVDEDDEESRGLLDDRLRMSMIVGPPATMGAYNTACLKRAAGRLIMLVNDDLIVRTHRWDRMLIDLDSSVDDGIYLAYGNDLFKGERVSTFPVLSRRACELLGDPYPAVYRGSMIDYHLFDTFKRLQHLGYDRIHYLPNLVLEHRHHRTGQGGFDATYQRRGRWDDDAAFMALRQSRQEAAARLAGFLVGEPEVRVVPESTPTNDPERGMAFLRFAKAFLADRDLPVQWRSFLFIWFCGRHLAARGLLPIA